MLCSRNLVELLSIAAFPGACSSGIEVPLVAQYSLGTAPPPVTVCIRGPIRGYIYIYSHIILIIQLLLSGGSTQSVVLKIAFNM